MPADCHQLISRQPSHRTRRQESATQAMSRIRRRIPASLRYQCFYNQRNRMGAECLVCNLIMPVYGAKQEARLNPRQFLPVFNRLYRAALTMCVWNEFGEPAPILVNLTAPDQYGNATIKVLNVFSLQGDNFTSAHCTRPTQEQQRLISGGFKRFLLQRDSHGFQ